MPTLCTIGYERAELADFLQTLADAGVQVLVDVRERPYSRRHEFSKDALARAVEDAGMAYRHERALGAPPWIRHAVQEDGDYDRFFRRYREHLAEQEPVVQRLAGEVTAPMALLCYEREPGECHRSVVAERLAELTGAGVHHLFVDPGRARQHPLEL